MLKRVFFGTGRGADYQSFEEYYSRLVARAPKVAPTIREARKECQSMLWAERLLITY